MYFYLPNYLQYLYSVYSKQELGTTTASPDNLRKKYLQTRANAIARRERTKSDISAETIQRATQLRSSAISRRDLKADPVRPSPLLSDSNVEATRQRLASFDLAGDTLREHGECPKPQRNNSVTSSRRKISEPFGFSRNGNGRQSEVRVLYRTKIDVLRHQPGTSSSQESDEYRYWRGFESVSRSCPFDLQESITPSVIAVTRR